MRKELRSQCALKAEAPFNLKWLDVDGDPISVDCPREWDEAIRLYIYNQETELLLHGGWGRGGVGRECSNGCRAYVRTVCCHFPYLFLRM